MLNIRELETSSQTPDPRALPCRWKLGVTRGELFEPVFDITSHAEAERYIYALACFQIRTADVRGSVYTWKRAFAEMREHIAYYALGKDVSHGWYPQADKYGRVKPRECRKYRDHAMRYFNAEIHRHVVAPPPQEEKAYRRREKAAKKAGVVAWKPQQDQLDLFAA